MSRLTKEEILRFPQTTYGRALGKTIASKVMNELLQYKGLEEEIGCPLEVRCKVVTDSVIYDENGVEYKVVNTYMDYFDCENPFDNEMGYCDLCAFSWVDYKETWFLKKDKSE